VPFYGWLSEWRLRETPPAEEMPADLVASYEAELLKAARDLIERIGRRLVRLIREEKHVGRGKCPSLQMPLLPYPFPVSVLVWF